MSLLGRGMSRIDIDRLLSQVRVQFEGIRCFRSLKVEGVSEYSDCFVSSFLIRWEVFDVTKGARCIRCFFSIGM